MLDTNFWKKYFKEYDVLNNLIPYDSLLNTIVLRSDIKKDDFVLDVGSGTGNLAIKLENAGAVVYGIDYSSEGIEIHKTKNASAKVSKHDITQRFPFNDQYFDKVVSNNVLYTIHPSKREFIFSEFYRVLKPNGLVVIANLSEGFKPFIIYKAHITDYIKKNGILRGVFHIISLLLPTIKIFYYNYLISKENSSGSYSFFKKDEQMEALKKVGFKLVSDTEFHYAGQSILNVAKK